MVPTTINGVVLLLVFLMPGFAYTHVRDRHRPTRNLSAFRETALAIFASTVAVVTGLVGLLIWARFNGQVTKEITSALASPDKFVPHHAVELLEFLVAYLVLATVVSIAVATKRFRSLFERFSWLNAKDPDSSAWGWLFAKKFENTSGESRVVASVTLEDGTWLSGYVVAWNKNADDGPDRDLVIEQPLRIKRPGGELLDYAGPEALVISASRVKWMTVRYVIVEPPK